MNRNQESHFSSVPRMHHQRSTFDRSCTNTLTTQIGDVTPIYCEEVLPGDSVRMETSKVIRLTTLLSPVMGDMYADIYYFFVPNRIIWNHWKEFMGENTAGAWTPTTTYRVPAIASPSGGFDPGTIADYLGYPIKLAWAANEKNAPSVLPLRAYAQICEDFFRDENNNSHIVIDYGDSNISGSNNRGIDYYQKGGLPFIAAKFHDYFTSCLPAPQKGPDVNIANTMSGYMPVVTGARHGLRSSIAPTGTSIPTPINFEMQSTIGSTASVKVGTDGSTLGLGTGTKYTIGSTGIWPGKDVWYAGTAGSTSQVYPTNLWAAAGLGDMNLEITVNSLRIAVLTQMYYESLARAGSRYEEQLQQFFGVSSPDSRVNHPEYLGGNRVRINVHEVTNSSQTDEDFLGDVGAKSVTADSHADFVKSFTEHGWLIGLMVVRYTHTYSQGLPRKFIRRDMMDFYNPMFANIGEQPVYDVELYANGNINNKNVFGYQEAWADYRYAPNTVHGYMRPSVTGSFGTWTFADNYSSKPTLGAIWLREDPTNVDRTLAVASTVSHSVLADFYFKTTWTRAMPMYSVPGAIGQF